MSSSLFQFNTLCTQLCREHRSLRITLNRAEKENEINMETLFELESILRWASANVEIQSLLIDSSSARFSAGLKNYQSLEADKIIKLQEKTLSIQKLIMQCPQNVIVDYGEGADNLGIDLFLCADLRLAHRGAKFKWDYLAHGLPALGSAFVFKEIAGLNQYKNWIFSAATIQTQSLESCGFLANCYDSENRQEVIEQYLESFCSQSAGCRIQNKLNINQHLIFAFEQTLKSEFSVFQGALYSQDWKKSADNFTPAKEIKNAVRMTLIKNEQEA